MSYVIRRHIEKCRRDNLQVVGPVYRPFEKRIQSRLVPFYRELQNFVDLHGKVSVRQFYYHLVEQPISSPLRIDVSTTERAKSAYQTVCNVTVRSRLGGLIPLDSIVDDTDLLGNTQYNYPIEDYLFDQVRFYRSNWFENQDVYVEVFLEKRALSRIFASVTNHLGVYLSVSGKYPTWAQVKSALDRFEHNRKDDNIILYFGDLDSTGKDMPRFLREAFPILGFTNVSVEEVVVNVNDVQEYNLPTIPLKRSDTKLAWFRETYRVNYGVEIDALPPDILRQRINDSILEHLDIGEINRKRREDREAQNHMLDLLENSR